MTLEQLRAVFNVPDDDTFQRRGDYNIRNLGRDIGLLSFFLIGINTVDLYNCTGIRNGRLIYNRTKTKNRRQDKAKIDIRIEPEALALIEKYRDPTGVRLFEFHRKYANSDIFNAIEQRTETGRKSNQLSGFGNLYFPAYMGIYCMESLRHPR